MLKSQFRGAGTAEMPQNFSFCSVKKGGENEAFRKQQDK